jgi:hypothetical protein
MAASAAKAAQASWKVSARELGWAALTVKNYTLAMIHFNDALATAQGEDVLEVITYILVTLITAREFGEAKKFLAQFDEVRRVLDQGGMGGADNREMIFHYLLSEVEKEETLSAVGTASTPASAGAKAGATSSAVGTASTPPSAGAKAGATSSAVGTVSTPASAGAKAGATSSAGLGGGGLGGGRLGGGGLGGGGLGGDGLGAGSRARAKAGATSSAGGGSPGQPAGFWQCKACTTKFSQFTATMFVMMAPRDPDEPVSCFFCRGLQ